MNPFAITAVAFIVACTVTTMDASAQTGTTRRTTQPATTERSSESGYFTDEVGLRLSIDAAPQEGYVDPTTYRLGRLDVLSIEIDGVTPVSFRGLMVNADGDLIIPTVGVIRVRDMLFSEAVRSISDMVRSKYATPKIHVSLERLKPVHVHITGDIGNAQSVVLSANTRLSRVLASIPGTDLRTRHIEIRSRDGAVRFADMESFRFGGRLDDNPFIQDGDVIVLTQRTWTEPRISITGAVPRQIRFDHRADDRLLRLFDIAGGYRFDADTTHFFISRIRNGRVDRLRIEGSVYRHPDLVLEPNDRLVIPRLPDTYVMQAATIQGEIRVPGTYPIIRNTTTLRDLIGMADGLRSTALSQGIVVQRRVPRILPDQGDLFARTSDQYTEGFQYLDAERRLSSTIFLDARSEADLDFIIVDQDVISIPKDETTVYVFGQVNRTGYYAFEAGQSVNRYLEKAGGFGLAAEPTRIFVIKSGSYVWLTPQQTSVESGDMIFVDRKPYEDIQTARQYDLQLRQLRNSNFSLALATVTTLATLLSTAYILTR